MVRKFNFIKKEKKQAMTLVALLVTMGVTIILIGMFLPLFVQGMVNIANGKSFDGSVNLSRRNGYFICYYNDAGRLMQTRADVKPNGRDISVVTEEAVNGRNCKFDVPTWPESFRLTLIGGGGAGAIGDFDMFDETYQPQPEEGCAESVELVPTAERNNRIYSFVNDAKTSCLLSKFFEKTDICLANKKAVSVRYEEGSGENCSLKIDTVNKSVSYNVGTVENSANLSGGTVYTNGVGLSSVGGFTGNCSAVPNMNTRLPDGARYSYMLDKTIKLSKARSGIKVKIPQGGETGQKVEQVVPYFNQNSNGQLIISSASLGAGGRRSVNGGKGGTTQLSLPGGVVARAEGGNAGSVDVETYYGDRTDSIALNKTFEGGNGNIDRFIPQPLQIINLRRGNGSKSVDKAGSDATYPGAGGGAGSVWVNNYSSATFGGTTACLAPRVRMNVSGSVRELECSPKSRTDFVNAGILGSFMKRSGSGEGAPGAILIAW